MVMRMQGVYWKRVELQAWQLYYGDSNLREAIRVASQYSDRHPAEMVVVMSYPEGAPDCFNEKARYLYLSDSVQFYKNSGYPDGRRPLPATLFGLVNSVNSDFTVNKEARDV